MVFNFSFCFFFCCCAATCNVAHKYLTNAYYLQASKVCHLQQCSRNWCHSFLFSPRVLVFGFVGVNCIWGYAHKDLRTAKPPLQNRKICPFAEWAKARSNQPTNYKTASISESSAAACFHRFQHKLVEKVNMDILNFQPWKFGTMRSFKMNANRFSIFHSVMTLSIFFGIK